VCLLVYLLSVLSGLSDGTLGSGQALESGGSGRSLLSSLSSGTLRWEEGH